MKSHIAVLGLLALSFGLLGNGRTEDGVQIVKEGGIRNQWMLADGVSLAAPGYPASFAGRGDNVCLALGYKINPDGSTSDFSLLKAWASSTGENEPAEDFWSSFAQAGAGALAQWRFKPRPEVSNAVATYTVATMTFMGKKAEDAAGLRAHCAISDLETAFKNAKPEGAKGMNRHVEDVRRQQQSERSMKAYSDRFQQSQP